MSIWGDLCRSGIPADDTNAICRSEVNRCRFAMRKIVLMGRFDSNLLFGTSCYVSDTQPPSDSCHASTYYTFLQANRHFFIWFRHIAIAFVTVSLGLNPGSHYELVHTCLTKRTTVWLGSYNRQRAFNFGSGFSIVKVECPLSIIWPKSNCGALRHSSVHLTKKTVPFPD